MAGKKTKGGGKGLPSNQARSKEIAKMYILNEISPEEFKKAYGKYNHAKSQ